MYRAVTRNIEVVVTPRFIADRSSPENNYLFWRYTISITNNGSETVQLKTRHWRITDAHGRRQEVRGAGVVGEEPVLKAGEAFEYSSGVPLPTPSGFMVGSYGMVSASGEHFDIDVPAFSLDSVETQRTLNCHLASAPRSCAAASALKTGPIAAWRSPAGRTRRSSCRIRRLR